MKADIVFVLNSATLNNSIFSQFRQAVIKTANEMLWNKLNESRVAFLRPRTLDNQTSFTVYPFTNDLNMFQQWIDGSIMNDTGSNDNKPVGDSLQIALGLAWRGSNNDGSFYEKVMILFVDGAPNGLFNELTGPDPWVLSNEFKKQAITLIIVAVGDSIAGCDDIYCALAENTGGRYIPMINFERIFHDILQWIGGDYDGTIHEALSYVSTKKIEQNTPLKYSDMVNRAKALINKCGTMADIQKEILETFNFSENDN